MKTLQLGKTAKIKLAQLKKKSKTVKRASAITVSAPQGTVTYALAGVSKAKFKKYFKVNKKTGDITVKKGLKKGTYKVMVKVTAAGTANYQAATKTATCKVKVAK